MPVEPLMPNPRWQEVVGVITQHTVQITIVAIAPPTLVAIVVDIDPNIERVSTFVYGMYRGGEKLLGGRHRVVVLNVRTVGGYFGEHTAHIACAMLSIDSFLEILFRGSEFPISAYMPKLDFQKFWFCHLKSPMFSRCMELHQRSQNISPLFTSFQPISSGIIEFMYLEKTSVGVRCACVP